MTPWFLVKVCAAYYIDALYQMIMTMTTVGYGAPPYDLTNGERLYLMIVMFVGLGLFTLITNEVFD